MAKGMTTEEQIAKILSMRRVLVSSDVFEAVKEKSLASRAIAGQLFGTTIQECKHLAAGTIMGIDGDDFDPMPPMPEVVLFSMPDGEFIFPVEQVRQMQALEEDRPQWRSSE